MMSILARFRNERKQMNERWESRNGEKQNRFTQTTKDTRSLKRRWTVLLRVRFLCRWRCLNIVTRAHDTNHSMRVQIERIWNETFRRENRSVSALWTFGEYGWDNIANMKCVCVYVCVCCLYCYKCCLSSKRELKCKVCSANHVTTVINFDIQISMESSTNNDQKFTFNTMTMIKEINYINYFAL